MSWSAETWLLAFQEGTTLAASSDVTGLFSLLAFVRGVTGIFGENGPKNSFGGMLASRIFGVDLNGLCLDKKERKRLPDFLDPDPKSSTSRVSSFSPGGGLYLFVHSTRELILVGILARLLRPSVIEYLADLVEDRVMEPISFRSHSSSVPGFLSLLPEWREMWKWARKRLHLEAGDDGGGSHSSSFTIG